ncbi:hypothetical protein R3W88_011739 [Solanum pinnatisectum]|uniref:Uncharacterized protein n=1 Tax=Solanum pinnatisectum TaxID=50273 RepID=A0AAV9L733_9SOLN|nr:hypothetical protein R3W88_011739 [Solanum pinnatisectum]
MQKHEELDFSEGTIDKKLSVENIKTNALMGREDPQYIKVSYNKNNTDMPQAHTETPGKTNWRNRGAEEDNHNSSHEVVQEGMRNGEDSQSTPAAQIENEKELMIVKHQDDEVSQELVVPLQIDSSCTRDFQDLQIGTSPGILMLEDVAYRDPNETAALIETCTKTPPIRILHELVSH